MKLLRLLFCLFFLYPVFCSGTEAVFCGKVGKLFFPSPDGDQEYGAIMLNFDHARTIKYALLDDNVVSAVVSKIQIIPFLENEGRGQITFAALLKLVWKKVCISGEAIQSHTAHHVPPVLLWNPRLHQNKE